VTYHRYLLTMVAIALATLALACEDPTLEGDFDYGPLTEAQLEEARRRAANCTLRPDGVGPC
jgi:hypothetical protein